MKNVLAEKKVRCDSCNATFTLREFGAGAKNCPLCEKRIMENDPIYNEAIGIPEQLTNKLVDTFREAHDKLVCGTDPDTALENFWRAIETAELFLQSKIEGR